MKINDAISSRTEEKPFITRRAWDIEQVADIKVLPTDTPDCCVIFSNSTRPCRGWQPTARDLVADDWIITE